MTVYEASRLAPVSGVGMFARLSAAFRSWNDARVTRKALGMLSDRELDDIGLCRGDIERIAERA